MTPRQTEIARLWNEGVSLAEIAAAVGSTANSVGVTVINLRAQGHPLPYRRNLDAPKHPNLRLAPEGHRRCTRCKVDRPVGDFPNESLGSVCGECVPIIRLAADRRHYERHPQKKRARNAVAHEVRMGRMTAPTVCERCAKPASLHAHHPDYDKPLDVEWLCRPCHIAEHSPERKAAAARQRSAA